MVATQDRSGADPIDPYAGLEAWQFTGKGTLWIKRFTAQFGGVADHKINGGMTFHLTPAERRFNSDASASKDMDPFQNGTCVPVRLTEQTSPEDRQLIEQNTATLTDEQIVELLGQHTNKLPKTLAAITNAVTLGRVLEIAQQQDVTNSKIVHIKARINEVAPDLLVEGAQRHRIETLPGEDEPDAVDVRGELDGQLSKDLGD